MITNHDLAVLPTAAARAATAPAPALAEAWDRFAARLTERSLARVQRVILRLLSTASIADPETRRALLRDADDLDAALRGPGSHLPADRPARPRSAGRDRRPGRCDLRPRRRPTREQPPNELERPPDTNGTATSRYAANAFGSGAERELTPKQDPRRRAGPLCQPCAIRSWRADRDAVVRLLLGDHKGGGVRAFGRGARGDEGGQLTAIPSATGTPDHGRIIQVREERRACGVQVTGDLRGVVGAGHYPMSTEEVAVANGWYQNPQVA